MTRPGGLTALAFINFGYALLPLFGVAVFLTLSPALDDPALLERLSPPERGLLTSMPPWLLWGNAGASLLSAVLLVASAIQYLQLRRAGRILGSAFAVVEIGRVVVTLVVVSMPLGLGSFGHFAYPLATLLLVNTVFARDLVR